MSQIFHRTTNIYSRLSILAVLAFLRRSSAGVVTMLYLSGYNTKQGVFVEQPVQFSHAHHVGGDGHRLPLLPYVGRGVGVREHPADQDLHELPLADLDQRARFSSRCAPASATTRPLEWTRVHDLPDFVYFNHSIHVNKGVGCATCHGQVDKMPLMYQETTPADELVPGLPPQSRRNTSGRGPGLQHGLGAAVGRSRSRRAAGARNTRSASSSSRAARRATGKLSARAK